MKTLCLSLTLLCAVAAQADPWRMTFGTWGGYSGGGGGMELRSDGSIFSLKADLPSRNVRTFRGQVEKAELERIHALALAARGVSFDEPANMTTRLTYEGEKRYVYRWEIGRTDIPDPLTEWVAALTSLQTEPARGPQWEGQENNETSAELIPGEESVLRLWLGAERRDFPFSWEVNDIPDLVGRTSGSLKVTSAAEGWIEGCHEGNAFRLPVWKRHSSTPDS